MKCRDLHQMMWPKAENTLSSAMQMLFDNHLSECKSCALLYKNIDAQQTIIYAEKQLLPSDSFASDVMKRISENKKLPHDFSLWQGFGYKTLMAASIAAAIALGVTTATLLNTSEAVQTSDEMAFLDDSAIEGLDTWFAE